MINLSNNRNAERVFIVYGVNVTILYTANKYVFLLHYTRHWLIRIGCCEQDESLKRGNLGGLRQVLQ